MRDRDDLHEYQIEATVFVRVMKRCALFLDMGLGKTIIVLTVMVDMLDDLLVTNVLVIAPLRVANTVWVQEARAWTHTKGLSMAVATGTAADRKAALDKRADITVINRENVVWLVLNFPWRWDMVVIDESTGFKSRGAKRFRALRSVLPKIDVMVLLTGTPAPNGLMDLWSQMYLIDGGQRLFKTLTNFRNRFFTQVGFGGFTYELRPGAAKEIKGRISDICLSMNAKDYLGQEDYLALTERVYLPADVMQDYKRFEKEFYLALDDDGVTAVSAGVLAGKLLQIANGAVYDENRKVHHVHDEKIERLKEIVEDNPSENLFVAYNFVHDLDRLKKAFPRAVTLSRSGKEMADWNAGKISMLLAHPGSAGHGLNAQFGGRVVVWFGLNWSLELYQQFIKRIHRQGQLGTVRVLHIVADGTIDERLIGGLAIKDQTQEGLLKHIRDHRR